MIVDLDNDVSLDPQEVGSKAASLGMARRAGLPVLPGLVVTADSSRHHLSLGAETLATRGSGGARLAISGEPLDVADELIARGSRLSDTLVARSSSLLEGSGEWAGAFASYVDVSPGELPKAVAGSWASAFTVAALERQEAAGVDPGSFGMAVLVQPMVDARVGGTAELGPDFSVVVRAVEGSPAPLLQGWARGVVGEAGPDGSWSGDELIELVGRATLDRIREGLLRAYEMLGANHCEWAADDHLWLLQLDVLSRPEQARPHPDLDVPVELIPTIQAIVSAPGRLGESLVLPWALRGLPSAEVDSSEDIDLDRVVRLSRALTSRVWGMPVERALESAERLITELKGPRPDRTVDQIRALDRPDAEAGAELMSELAALRGAMVSAGAAPDAGSAWHLSVEDVDAVLRGEIREVPARIGTQGWEPLITTAVLEHGSHHQGTPAAAGIGGGSRLVANQPARTTLTHRAVLTADKPFASLAQLLWDAAGLVTRGGSPAAHLFESARSLGIPAVCGVDLPGDERQILAVDGYAGVVASIPLTEAGH